MAQIPASFRLTNSFDPETLRALGAAYDLAVAGLNDGGQPDTVCEIIASRIVAAATRGERDPQKLCQVALRGIVERE